MNNLIEETPNKQRTSKSAKKNRRYEFKNGSTLVLFYPRLTEFTKHHKTVTNNSIINHACQQASTVIVWIAKQNRYSIIKGFATDYQIDIMEQKVEELYNAYKKSKWLDKYKPYNVLDYSHIPPNADFISDLT